MRVDRCPSVQPLPRGEPGLLLGHLASKAYRVVARAWGERGGATAELSLSGSDGGRGAGGMLLGGGGGGGNSALETNNPLSLAVEVRLSFFLCQGPAPTDSDPRSPQNPWQSWFADVELRKVIRQDVERT